MGAIILFFILALWQMPHAFAIAIYRLEDYRKANIAVLPVKKGIFRTKVQMLIYTILFIVATLSLTFFGYTSIPYTVVMAILGTLWLLLSISGFSKNKDEERSWARKEFIFSIIILLSFCVVITIEHFI